MTAGNVMTKRDTGLALAIVVYCVLVIAGHDFVSQTYVRLIENLDRKAVESSLYWATVLPGIAGFVWLLALRGSRLLLAEGAFFGVLLWLSSSLLISTNVECAHYPQYAVLGFLMRCLIDGDMAALLACNLVGMVDELIQYVSNPQYTSYLDFNDIILNMVGAMVGITLWRWLKRREANPLLVSLWRRSLTAAYALVATSIVWGLLDGRVLWHSQVSNTPFTSLLAVEGRTAFVLSYVDTTAFYLSTGLGRKYHVMDAAEWFWATLGLLGVAWCFSFYRKPFPERPSATPCPR